MNACRIGIDHDPVALNRREVAGLMDDDLLLLPGKIAVDIGLGAEAFVILDDERQALFAGAGEMRGPDAGKHILPDSNALGIDVADDVAAARHIDGHTALADARHLTLDNVHARRTEEAGD